MNTDQVRELLYQALETERGSIEFYRTAIRCALNEDLKEEWEEYLEQTDSTPRCCGSYQWRIASSPFSGRRPTRRARAAAAPIFRHQLAVGCEAAPLAAISR